MISLAGLLVLGGLTFGGVALAHNNGWGLGFGAKAKVGLRGWGNFWKAKERGTTTEIHLYQNGTVLVRGAEVTSVSGSDVNATTSWGDAEFNFELNTDSETRFFGDEDHNSLGEIDDEDMVSFYGEIENASSAEIEVNAKVIRNWE